MVRIGVSALGKAWRHSAARRDSALGARGADEILVERFEQRRARHAGEDRRLHQAERDRRQNQRAERPQADRPSRESRPTGRGANGRRRPAPEDAEPEIGHGEPDLARRHHQRVAGAPAPVGGVDARASAIAAEIAIASAASGALIIRLAPIIGAIGVR